MHYPRFGALAWRGSALGCHSMPAAMLRGATPDTIKGGPYQPFVSRMNAMHRWLKSAGYSAMTQCPQRFKTSA